MQAMLDVSQALASPAAWEEPERVARLAPRLPEETGLRADDAGELLRLCESSADPDGALAGRRALSPLAAIASAAPPRERCSSRWSRSARPRATSLLISPLGRA